MNKDLMSFFPPDSPLTTSRLQILQETLAASLLDREQRIPSEFFAGDATVAAERLRIYRGNLHAVWKTALRNAFPVMRQLVGEEFFDQLAILYGQKFPSQSGDLNGFGLHFADFLQHEESVFDYPYFSAVAALEWQVHKAYYAADADILDLATFVGIAGDKLGQYALECHPALALFSSNFAAVPIYLAHQGGEIQTIDVALDTPSFALIKRTEWQVHVTPLNAAEYAGLCALHDGVNLGEALERAIESATEHDAELNVTTMLQSWFERGIFIGCRCKE